MATLPSFPSSWDDLMPDDDSPYNDRSDERQAFFEDLAQRFDTTKLSPPIYAFLQVGNLETLRTHAENVKSWQALFHSSPESETSEENANELRARYAVYLWSQSGKRNLIGHKLETLEKTQARAAHKRSHSTALSSTSAPARLPQNTQRPTSGRTRSGHVPGATESSVRRAKTVEEKTLQRDKHSCILTNLGAVHVAHIYPWCGFGETNPGHVANFWKLLRVFWPEETVSSWRSKIFVDPLRPNEGTDTVKNTITLSAQAHRLHTRGAFALRPVRMRQDKTELELEFHWLARRERETMARMGLLDRPASTRGRNCAGPNQWLFRLNDDGSAVQLETGYRFTITTDDPEDRPLPDPELLEL